MELSTYDLASFPGRSHLQYLIACSTEGESLRHLVMCGYIRHTESRHTGGGAQWRILKLFLVPSVWRLEARALARQHQYRSWFKKPGTVQCKNGNYYCQAPPLMCLTSVYLNKLHNCMWLNLPGLAPIFAYCKLSNTGGGNNLRTRLPMIRVWG